MKNIKNIKNRKNIKNKEYNAILSKKDKKLLTKEIL